MMETWHDSNAKPPQTNNHCVSCRPGAVLGQLWRTKTDKETTTKAALAVSLMVIESLQHWCLRRGFWQEAINVQCSGDLKSYWVSLVVICPSCCLNFDYRDETIFKKGTYFPFPSGCKLLELLHVDSRLLSAQCLLSVFWLISQTQYIKKIKKSYEIIFGKNKFSAESISWGCQHSVYKLKTCQKIRREHLNCFIKSVSKRVKPWSRGAGGCPESSFSFCGEKMHKD